MITQWWYWKMYYANRAADIKNQYRIDGVRAFLPHRHQPSRIPAADGWYCCRCGTRKAIVQKRGRQSVG